MKLKKLTIYDDAFYFIYFYDTDLISIVSIYNGTNQAIYHGCEPNTIDKFRKDVQSNRIAVIEKITLPKFKIKNNKIIRWKNAK